LFTLGIETSGQSGTIALLRDGSLLEQVELSRSGRRHARTLVAELQGLVKRAELTPADVDVVAVSIGPGSFTGLRVGVVCAKTLAYVTGCKLVGVDTLAAIAAGSGLSGSVDVIVNAFRGELFVGRYDVDESSHTIREGEIRIESIESFLAAGAASVPVLGPGVPLLAEGTGGSDELKQAVDEMSPTAEWIARLGEASAVESAFVDPFTLQPHYLRRSAAEENANAKRG